MSKDLVKFLEPVLLCPDGNVIDSNNTHHLNAHVTRCGKTGDMTFFDMLLGSLSGCYGILHLINLIFERSSCLTLFSSFSFCVKIRAYRISQIV